MRVGVGYDIHRLVDKRPLYLGGVQIPYNKGLLGHSDGDVLLHAIIDAMFGAAGCKDLGEHFPNTNVAYKGVSSIELLKRAYGFLSKKGYSVKNIDSTVIAEEPMLSPFKKKIKARIADVLHISSEDVSIKATTNEGLGSLGKGEGIAAYAVVLLKKHRTRNKSYTTEAQRH